MKVVINVCFGGFSLSAMGIQRLAELKGRKCFFFEYDFKTKKHSEVTLRQAENSMSWGAFDVNDSTLFATDDGYRKHNLDDFSVDRGDPDLVRVVEELGGGHRTGASGSYAELRVVEIPDGVDYTIEEYDGNEHIAEAHRTWR